MCLLKWHTKFSNKTNGYCHFQAGMNISQPYFNMTATTVWRFENIWNFIDNKVKGIPNDYD